MTSHTTAFVVHWAGNLSANFKVSTSIPCLESNHFYHPTTTTMVQATSIFSLDHWSNLKRLLLSLTTTKTHSPHSSLNDLLKDRTRLSPISGFLLHTDWNQNSLLQPIRPFGTWCLHTSSCLPCSPHFRHTGLLTIPWTYQLLFYLKIFTNIGDNNNELYLLSTYNVPGVA